MIRLGVIKQESAFLPEARAYVQYFNGSRGVLARCYDSIELAEKSSDVLLLFCGFFPIFRHIKRPVIAEYHSLSAGRNGRLKDLIKRWLNLKADYYVFLSERVRTEFGFNNVPYSIRGMGYDADLVDAYSGEEKVYDFVYCGSVHRPGVRCAISKLASLGLSGVVVGGEKGEPIAPGVDSIGRVSREECYMWMARAKYGLNFTPDEFPLNIQDSTKVIEYCAMGLGVITNYYDWVVEFEAKINARFLDIDSVSSKQSIEGHAFLSGSVASYAWNEVIARSGIEQAVLNLGS